MIELLLSIAVTGSILLLISLLLSTLVTARIKNETIAEVEQQGIQALQLMTQTLRNAESITTPTAGNTATALAIAVFAPANSPTVFDLATNALRSKEGAAAAENLTSSRVVASGLNFQNLSRADTPGVVRIEFTLTHVNPEGRNEYDYAKTFFATASLRHP